MTMRRFPAALLVLAATPLGAQQPILSTMSLDELRACGGIAATMQERRQAIADGDVALVARGRAIAAEARAIDIARKRIKLTDRNAVAAFNARGSRLRAQATAYNGAMSVRRQSVIGLSAQSDAFNVNCANRPYDQADVAQLPAAQQRALAAGSRTVEIPVLPTDLAQAPAANPDATPVAVIISPPPPSRPSASEISPPLPQAGLREAAERGDAEAQYQLGRRLHDGAGFSRDPAAALGWLLKAAAQQHAGAAFSASRMLSEGDDVPIDKAKSLVLLRQTAAAGQPNAEHNLGLWYATAKREPDHMRRALEWMTRAADRGDPESQFVLARFLLGGGGLPRDQPAALKWLRQSSDQGLRAAQLELGQAYAKGDGIARDQVEALKWYRLAAGMTRVDASKGCKRLLMADSETRSRATEAANALAAKLSAYEADKAAANAEEWNVSYLARKVGGCGTA